jgi:3-oxoacyl-[acyl-carrier-protein] synthase III
MSVNMHIREVPDEVHEELQRRASSAGMTLRQYTVKVLDEHVATPTMDEWMERIARRRARWLAEDRHIEVDAAEAVRAARRDDERAESVG